MSRSMRRLILGFVPTLVFCFCAEVSRAERTLRGRVIAADGKPAAGATVWASRSFQLVAPEPRETRCDDKTGAFELALPKGEWRVWARSGREGGEAFLKSTTISIHDEIVPDDVTIRLETRGLLRARLIEEESDKPIAGGRVYFDNAHTAISNELGIVETGGMTRGNHEAFVVAPGRVRKRVLFDLTNRIDAELNIRVPRGGKVVGKVVAAETGKPIPGAVVGRYETVRFFSRFSFFDPCDEQGKFDYDGLSFDTTVDFVAIAAGYRRGITRLTVLEGEKPPEVEFRLERIAETRVVEAEREPAAARDLTGVVRGPTGDPVERAEVRLLRSDWNEKNRETRTDAAGRFKFAGVRDDKPRRLAVIARNLAPAFPTVEKGEKRGVEVKLEAGVEVSGQVVDRDGIPVKGVAVIPMMDLKDPINNDDRILKDRGVETAADGSFHLHAIPRVGVRFDFLGSGRAELRNVELRLGGEGNVVVLAAEGGVHGRVVDQNGGPVRRFRVLFLRVERNERGAIEGRYNYIYRSTGVLFDDDRGEFAVGGLESGRVHRLAIVAEGYGVGYLDGVIARPVSTLAATARPTIRLGPPSRLRIEVVEAETKRPIPRARIALINGEPSFNQKFDWENDLTGNDTILSRTDNNGVRDFSALAFGESTILLRAEGYARRRIARRDGGESIRVEMEREAVVAGEVRDAKGRFIEDIYVNLHNDNGDSYAAWIDGDRPGRFRIGELAAGEYRLEIGLAFGSPFIDKLITLKRGETTFESISGVDRERVRKLIIVK